MFEQSLVFQQKFYSFRINSVVSVLGMVFAGLGGQTRRAVGKDLGFPSSLSGDKFSEGLQVKKFWRFLILNFPVHLLITELWKPLWKPLQDQLCTSCKQG